MKKLFSLVLAGFVGGSLAILVMPNKSATTSEALINQSPKVTLTANTNANPAAPFDFVKAAEIVTPAVVHIEVEESRELANQRYQQRSNPFDGFFNMDDFFGNNFYPRSGAGSGVIISENGYIVTNNHVIENGDIIKVTVEDRQYDATKVGTDPSTDLALLKIEASGLTAVEFANSDNVRVGEWVVAIGNPFSYLKSTVTAGIVSAKGRDIDILKNDKAIEEFIQTDAAINPGNSGGALVNPEGKLIGINTAIATPTGVYAGYSFAIPSNLVLRIIEDIKENGDIERGRLGIRGRTVDNIIKDEEGLNIDYGFLVERVDQKSGAKYAGILPGDIIVKANSVEVNNFEDLYGVVEFAKVGDTINLVVIRKNKEIEIPVYLRKGI